MTCKHRQTCCIDEVLRSVKCEEHHNICATDKQHNTMKRCRAHFVEEVRLEAAGRVCSHRHIRRVLAADERHLRPPHVRLRYSLRWHGMCFAQRR
jgi:hypothetical protein